MTLSDEVREWSDFDADMPANEWADRIATLERELAEALDMKVARERDKFKKERDTLRQAVDAARAFVAIYESDRNASFNNYQAMVAAINDVKDDS